MHPDAWWTPSRRRSRRPAASTTWLRGVGGQQHGMVCLDAGCRRPAGAAVERQAVRPGRADLIEELGGPQAWADAVGPVPVASFTVTKLRWLATTNPKTRARTAAVCLPHDWLTWRLAGSLRHRRPRHRPRRRERHRLLVARDRRLPPRPARARARPRRGPAARARPGRVRARDAVRGRCSARAPATTRPPRSAWVRRRRRRRLDRHLGGRLRGRRRSRSAT